MALDTLTSMVVFRDALEEGSLAAAARKNGLSAEMAGRHLASLEARLGVRLVNRSTRKLSLTDAGRAYLERCRAILEEIAFAEADAGALQAEPRGHLQVAAPLAFATAALAPAVDAYMTRYGRVSLSFDLSEREVDLLAAGYDVALRLGDLPSTSLVAHRLGEFPLVLVAASGYFARSSAPEDPQGLSGQTFLLYTQTADPDRFILSSGREKATVKPAGPLRSSDIGFLTELALLGRGLLLAPSFAVEQHIREGRLIQVLPRWTARVLPLHAVMPHRSMVPATVRSFVDFIAEWFAGRSRPHRP